MSNNRAGHLLPLQTEGTGLSKEKQVVEAEALSRLRASGYRPLCLISCEFHEGVLTLRGHVSSFHLKQVAQTLIRGLHGVGEINNRLEVIVDGVSDHR
jgi:osmotically-inducible protein OsmY